MTYKGKFRPKNRAKYKGDFENITYRSLWERNCFRFVDEHPDVLKWGSEIVIVPYRCKTDGRMHRYFTDLYIEFKSGQIYLIEIKPAKETTPPKPPKNGRKTARFIKEVMTYAKNCSKWESAEKYCKERNYIFEIWTENSLKSLGIQILKGSK